MLVKLQTPQYLIYAEIDTPQRVTDLALKNRIPVQTCYAILHEIEKRGDFQITWASPMMATPTPSEFRESEIKYSFNTVLLKET